MSQACYIASLALLDLCGVDFPKKPEYTYEDIQFPDGYTKPSKEVYDEAFSRYLNIELFKELRQERSRRLAEVDWVFSTDYQIPDDKRGVWIAYRRALRELPSTTEDPTNPVWPEKPMTTQPGRLRVNIYFGIKKEAL